MRDPEETTSRRVRTGHRTIETHVEYNLVDGGYKRPGTLPSDIIRATWAAKEYRPIKDAVRAAEELKEKGNQ